MTASSIHICDDWIVSRLPDLRSIHQAYEQIRACPDWQEVVPGMDSISVQFDPGVLLPDEAAAMLSEQLSISTAGKLSQMPTLEIPVCYDGEFAPDREMVARKLQIAAEELPTWHSNLRLTVAILGFLPGFGYLQSEEKIADIDRLDQPRQKVTAGSIGIIGRQSCIYSFDSPGGWPLIGRTPLKLFDHHAEQPNLLVPGQRIKFAPVSREKFDLIASGSKQWD